MFSLFFILTCGITANAQQLQSREFSFTTSDSVQLYVKVAGSGPLCFFIHGGPGQGCRSFEQMNGNALEKCLTMVYLDQRGSGPSGNAANYHLNRVLQDVEELRQHLQQDKILLLAHSFGGIIAFNYARKYTSHVNALLLANVTLNFLSSDALAESIQYQKQLLGEDTSLPAALNRDSLLALSNATFSQVRKAGMGYKMLSDDPATARKQMEVDNYKRTSDFGMAVITQQHAYPEYLTDYRPATAQLPLPVLTIVGANDHAVGSRGYKQYAFPQQTVKILPGGHMLYYENSPAFVTTICGFVQHLNLLNAR